MTDALASVLQDIGSANGLPNAHYIDEGTYRAEKAPLFFSTWAGLGFGKDAPDPGDAAPVDFLGVPLVMIRDKSGVLRVFQNTCRHRGMILIEEKRNIQGAIRCPYHSWCYAHDGALKSTPHVGGPGQNLHADIDRSTLGLVEVRSHIWQDVVFVNLDGQAPPFEDAHAELIARWAEFGQPIEHGGAGSGFTLEVSTNWKLAVENYCESYHLPWVHPGLNSYSRLEDHYNIEDSTEFSGQGTLVYRQLTSAEGARLEDFAGLSEKWNEGAEYIALFPNVLLGVHRDHCFAIVLEPQAVDRTRERIELYYTPGTATDAAKAPLLAENAALWKTVFEEDIFVVEGMQRGRQGVLFDGGRFSPAMDGATHAFHAWVARRMLAA